MITNERFIKEISSEMFEETNLYDVYYKYCGRFMLEEIYTTDAVYMAACHCANGFRDRQDTFAFMQSPWLNSYALAKKVREHKFKPAYYQEKVISERGKMRTIRPPKFECKVVQKVMCDYVLRTLLEPKMIYQSYASIRGKGTEKCYADVLIGLNKNTYGSIITITDFRNFFGSISHEVLEAFMTRYISDKNVVDLFMMFCEGDDGLSLGNEVSQVPASFFPSQIDHAIKDKLGCRFFYRYMDDSLSIAKDKKEAEKFLSEIRIQSASMSLRIKEDKIQTINWGEDFEFCKERYIFNKEKGYYYRLMNPNIVRTQMRKMNAFKKKLAEDKITREEVEQQVKTVVGMIKGRPNTYKQVEKIETKLNEMIKNIKQADNMSTTPT